MSDRLMNGEKLERGQSLTSRNGAYTLTLQDDGNLVLAARSQAVWATGTEGLDVVRAEVQTDGNFVLYTADRAVVWTADTTGPGAHMVLQDDRNIVIVAADGVTVLWTPNCYVRQDEVAAEEQAAQVQAAQAAPPAPAPSATPAPQTYTVARGDTLSAIAKRFYGHASEYRRIAAANNIANPDLIHPGQQLVIPA